MAVRYIWFRKKFGYITRSYSRGDWDRNTNFAYGIFIRHYIGVEKSLYFSKTSGLRTIKSYYKDFFDDLFDPRFEEIEYPYKNITLAHMAIVIDMEERLELLDFADKNNMQYSDFCDFISNWVSCYNEKYGEKYQIQLRKNSRMMGIENLLKKNAKRGIKEYEDI